MNNRDRLVYSLADRVLRLATPEGKALISGSIRLGLRAASDDEVWQLMRKKGLVSAP